MDITISLNEAIDIANKAHEGQLDKAGMAYIHHPVRVANSLVTPQHKLMGLLHDVLEGSDIDEGDLFKAGVGLDMIEKLKLLTRSPAQPYDEYITGIITDFDASIVKLADLRDNMDLTRLPELTDRDLKRTRKYHKAFHRILEATNQMMAEDEELARGPKQ